MHFNHDVQGQVEDLCIRQEFVHFRGENARLPSKEGLRLNWDGCPRTFPDLLG